MKKLALFSVLLFTLLVDGNAQTTLPPIKFTFTLEDSFKNFSPSFTNAQKVALKFLPNGFQAIIFPDSVQNLSEWTLTFDAPLDFFIIEGKDGSISLRQSLRNINFSITANRQVNGEGDTIVVFENRQFSRILSSALIPGGARFKNDSIILGIVVGALEIVPIPLWFYFNHKREDYFEKSVDWANNWEFARADFIKKQIDYNYDKSQDYRRYQNLSASVFIGAFLFNFVDTVLNIKTHIGFSSQDLRRKKGLIIRSDFKNGELLFHFERIF